MTIVVIGGSGLIGMKLVSRLRGSGHEIIAASPPTGVHGADVVVDVSDSLPFEGRFVFEYFEAASEELMRAELAAEVKHHVALSVVGIDRNPEIEYFRAKMAQERLIKDSGVPYTIVRSTLFFEFVRDFTERNVSGEAVHVSPALVQPIAADDVVAVVADVALRGAVNGTIEIAGPEKMPFDEAVREYLVARNDRRRVVSDVHARYFGGELNDRSLTPGGSPRIGLTRFQDWLKTSRAHA